MHSIPRRQSARDKRRIPSCDRNRRNLPQLYQQRSLLADAGGLHLGRYQMPEIRYGRTHFINDPFQNEAPVSRTANAIFSMSSRPRTALLQAFKRLPRHRRY